MGIEEEFFKIFGIEKNYTRTNADKTYPSITAEILLKLICILNEYGSTIGVIIQSKNLNDLKNEVLKECVRQNEIVFKQVQALFGEFEY